MTDTPECNAMESMLNSYDYRAWMTLARSLERRLREHEQLRKALQDIEMETRDGAQWTVAEINECARTALALH